MARGCGAHPKSPNYFKMWGVNMFERYHEEFGTKTIKYYQGFGSTKLKAWNDAHNTALWNNEPKSVLEMMRDCRELLKSENDFIHAVEVEYTRLIPENCGGYSYECIIRVEEL